VRRSCEPGASPDEPLKIAADSVRGWRRFRCHYLLKGVREFPDAERLAAELHETGFREVDFERVSLGIVAIHTARKAG
jgi:ubiquinone/menaquinone biosynthesis C-methylase UbiE